MSLWEHALPAPGTPSKVPRAALLPWLARNVVWEKFGIDPCSSTLFLDRHSSGDRHPALPPENEGSGPSQPSIDSVSGGKGRGILGDKSLHILQTGAAQLLTSLVCWLSSSPAHRHPPHISAPFLTRAPCITLLPHQGLIQNTEWDTKTTPFGWKKYSG